MANARKQNQADMKRITVVSKGRLSNLCQYCLFKTEKTKSFNKHMRRHKNERKLYVCKMCDVDLYNPYDMANHFQLSHPGQDPYQCPQCSFTTDKVLLIRKHWRDHFYFRCEFCTYKASRKSLLRFHLNAHGYRKFPCAVNECMDGFDTREALENHKTEYHKIKSDSAEEHRLQGPDLHYNTKEPDSKTVQVFIKDEIVSVSEDSVAEDDSEANHDNSHTQVYRFSKKC